MMHNTLYTIYGTGCHNEKGRFIKVDRPFGSFGRMVREARLRQDMSQADLARRTGVNASSVSRAEGGVVRPTEATVVSLANALGLDVDRCLLAAGYAPKNLKSVETLAASRGDGYDNSLPLDVLQAVEVILDELRQKHRNEEER